jgi:drug/metabolite transporter (DMT)-like permease
VHSQNWQGRLLVIVAAVLWSTSAFFAKAPIFDNWPVESRGLLLAFWRALFACLPLVFLVRKPQFSWRLLPMITVFALMNWTYLSCLVYCEPALTIWLQYTAPAWVFLISWIFFRESPGIRDWLLLAFATVGVAIIVQAEIMGATPKGVQLGLLSGVFFASVVVTLRGLRDFESTWLIFLNHLMTAILFAPYLIYTGIYPNGSQWLYLAGFGIFQMGLPYVLFARALKAISSHEASGLSLLEPILVPVWFYVAWRNAPDYQAPAITTLVGGSLILVGLLMRYVKFKRNPTSTEIQKPMS